MEFRTAISLPPLRCRINHSRSGLMLGSCFASNISARLSEAKFPVETNPFGVLYNPASVAGALETLYRRREFTRGDLTFDPEGLWVSFAHHGSFSSPDPGKALDAINAAVQRGSKALDAADYAVITLGTAWIYELADGGGVAANCHKFPAGYFVRRRLSVEQIVEQLGEAIDKYLRNKDVVLTVSPIRHIKDSLAENSRSKAILIEACHRIAESREGVEYFPAYEIMIDDLRDYRFYDRDMVHPSAVAVDYIWERFCEASMDGDVMELVAKIKKITEAAAHRPLHPDSESYASFCRKMLGRIHDIHKEFAHLDFGREAVVFQRGLR